jgi:hypothetical protein
MSKTPTEYERDTSLAKLPDISPSSPASLLGMSAGICQTALIDESGTISTQIGTHDTYENGRNAWYALYDTTL